MTQAFNLSQFANKVNSSGLADLTTAVTGTLPVANGGTNQTTYTDGQLLIGNTTGNTLTKSTLTAGSGVTITNGSGAITIAAASGQIQTEIFVGPGTWTCPATTTQVRVWVVGGGGASTPGQPTGGTSSFGPAVSATGGSGTTNGAGTVSVGTALKTGSLFTLCQASVQTGSPTTPSLGGQGVSFGVLSGLAAAGTPGTNPTANLAYSTSGRFMAGMAGGNQPTFGAGGIAAAIVPVSAPVTITVGACGTSGSPTLKPCGGAVAVEWVS